MRGTADLIVRATWEAPSREITALALGELRGRFVVLVGTDSGGIRWFDADDLSEFVPPGAFTSRAQPPEHAANPMDSPVTGAVTALHVVGSRVVSAVGDTVSSTDIVTGDPIGPDLVHPDRVLAALPGDIEGVPVVATSCADFVLRLWDTTTGKILNSARTPRKIDQIVSADAGHLVILDEGCLIAISTGHTGTLT